MRHVSRTHRVAIVFFNILTPRTCSLTYKPKEVSHSMGGIFLICWTFGICRCFLAAIAFESKANSTECSVEKKARSILSGKWFANGEAKAQMYEFGDGKTNIQFIGATRSPHVELLLWHGILRLEKTVFAQAFGNKGRTVSSVETGIYSRKQRKQELQSESSARIKLKKILVPWGLQCITIWRKFTSTYRSWNWRIHQSKNWAKWRWTYWYVDYSCHLQWKQMFILDKISVRTIELRWELKNVHERVCGRDQVFVQHRSEIDIGWFWRDHECESHWQQLSILDKSQDISCTSD